MPQFDPETGKENRFSEVDHNKLERFGWYPFSPKLAQKILKSEQVRVTPTGNPAYTVTVKNGDRLVAHRTNTVKLQMHKAGVCHGQTIYVLGVEGGKILQIDEEGRLVDVSG